MNAPDPTFPDLTIPPFLRSENRPPPPKVRLRQVETRWKMPKAGGERRAKRERKEAAEVVAMSAVRAGADTFQKIRTHAETAAPEVDPHDIQLAIKRLVGQRRLYQKGRRYGLGKFA